MAPHQLPEPAWSEFGREIGHRLARARAAKGLSQDRVARMAGISAYTYQKYEKGQSRPGDPMNPEMATLIVLCQALGISLAELVVLEDAPDLTVGG